MPYLTGDTIPVTKRCKVIRIPDNLDFLDALNGQMLDLCKPRLWETHGTKSAQEYADAWVQVYEDYTTEECELPNLTQAPPSFDVAGYTATLFSGGAITTTLNAGQINAHHTGVTPIGISNGMHFNVFCTKGLYHCFIIAIRQTSNAIVTVTSSGGLSSVNVDMYGAALNNIVYPVDLIMNGEGHNAIVLRGNSKNASSSNYNFLISAIYGHKYADYP